MVPYWESLKLAMNISLVMLDIKQKESSINIWTKIKGHLVIWFNSSDPAAPSWPANQRKHKCSFSSLVFFLVFQLHYISSKCWKPIINNWYLMPSILLLGKFWGMKKKQNKLEFGFLFSLPQNRKKKKGRMNNLNINYPKDGSSER